MKPYVISAQNQLHALRIMRRKGLNPNHCIVVLYSQEDWERRKRLSGLKYHLDEAKEYLIGCFTVEEKKQLIQG